MKKTKSRLWPLFNQWVSLKLLAFLVIWSGGACLYAQSGRLVEGTVVDSKQEPLYGVTILVKDKPGVGVITDFDGRFSINLAPEDNELVISFLGMTTQTVNVVGKSTLSIVMVEDSKIFDEVVVVGFGQQRKESVVGAISQTTAKVLERTGGVSSLGQALTGNLPGVVTMTTTGRPGEEDPEIVIRGVSTWNGGDPLVLVDGIERPMNSVDINSVANISVLKDASATAVFGVRGANGVILVTTKRGEEGRANIDVNYTSTFKTYSKLPPLMDSYDALLVRNQVIEHELPYKPDVWSYYLPYERIHKYRYPANQQEYERYPNVDWIDELLRDYATSHNANINVSGGTKFAKYYVSLDYTHEGDLYKDVNNNRGYETGFGYDRINVRSNLDFALTKTTTFKLNLSGSHGVKQGTNYNQYENLAWSAFYGIAPDAFRPKYSDGSFGYYQPNPTQASTNSMMDVSVNGHGFTSEERLNTDFVLEQDLGFITKGLKAHARLAFDNSFNEVNRGVDDTNDWEDNPQMWIDPEDGSVYRNTDQDGNYKFDFKNNNAWMTGAGTVDIGQTYRRMNYSGQIDYNRTFGSHTVGVMGNVSREEYSRGSNLPIYRENWVFRTTYDYLKRYMLEYNGAYNGSEKFAPENRFVFFQSGALGWMFSEEPLFKKLNANWVDMLKFRLSYGQIGDDRTGNPLQEFFPENRWLYIDRWASGGRFRQGLNGVNGSDGPYDWYYEANIGNPSIQWEVSTKLDIALDYAFFNGALAGSLDYFTENRTNILLAGRDRAIPSYFGATPPRTNMGEVDTKGYELELRWNKPIAYDWRLWGNVFYTHASNKIIERDDPELLPEYQKQANKAINQARTYVDYGYFNTWDELYASTAHDALDAERMPGNYIILDYDADGVITSFDQVPYGFSNVPQNTINFQFGLDYKGFSGFVQFYGASNVTRSVGLQGLGGVRNTVFDEGSYWSKDNVNADVPLPRWQVQASDYTNGTRFMFDGSYLRLKYAEISYTFSKEPFMQRLGLTSLKLFVNGNNLYLWTEMPDDRETNTGGWSAYPTQKRYNLGLRLSL
ncbi:MAG TPA: SusC/RagA family TonB-linked outer membrane protein [Marinilabiliaceae bacterium]|nr:SusC/RagA family TonB-linked outer membrane protein [Marinilabiliaceae bacterium]